MLFLCHGPDLTELADHLLKTLEQKPLKNPLAPERIVVNNYGMGRWLTTYGANATGIVANWDIHFLAEQMWDLIRLMDDKISRELPSECDPMTWTLMHLLDEHEDDPEFDILIRYIRDSDVEARSLRNWKLCRRIAGVFDQYLIYRPEMLLRWERGELVYNHNIERWQARLWQYLIQHWTETFDHSGWIHRAQIQQNLIQEIDHSKLEASALPQRIVIFGVPTMPPAYIRIFIKLSKQIDVYVYVLDDVHFNDENPLIASLGKEGKEYAEYFIRYVEEDPAVVSKSFSFSYRDNPPAGNRLLDHIRRDLVHNREYTPLDAKADKSVQVHSCHSAMREVEVLYDQILALLDDDPDLVPSQILIMTPNMETYAPMIDAVFGTTEKGLPQLPYTISDRGSTISGPLTAAFLKLMKLIDSRFKVTHVLEFVGLEPLREAFGFTEEDLDKIERWVRDNRIRWGIDGSFRTLLELPETKGFTWLAGLDRMMLGFAMNQQDDKLFEGIYPYSEIENFDDVELMGSFTALMRTLFEFHERIKKIYTLSEWSLVFRELADRFLPDTKAYFTELSQIRDRIGQITEQSALIQIDSRLPYKVMRSYLEQKLSEQSENGGLLGRGVTFSSLAPMRSIPFKVIGMLGMNDGAFPCRETPVEFNLMARYKKPGDRSRREGDRHLFLENILSAQKVLYFSYVGQSNREDAELSPSVVLQEFLDYIENRFGIKAGDITTTHRLQAFSRSYFTGSRDMEKLFSYSALQEEIASGLYGRHDKDKGFISEKLPAPDEQWRKLGMKDLISFFQHPSRYLLQIRLGVYIEEEEISTDDREPFFLEGLEGYRLGQELLDRYLKGHNPEAFREVAGSIDLLPQGWPGEEAFYNKLEEVRRFGRGMEEALTWQPVGSHEVDLVIGAFRITGLLDHLFSDGLTLYRFGTARAKDFIELWVKHLVFQVLHPAGSDGISRLFTRDDRRPYVCHTLMPMPEDEAAGVLDELLDIYWGGLIQPLIFFPESAYAYAYDRVVRNKSHEESIGKALTQWQGSRYTGFRAEGDDPYTHRIFGYVNPFEGDAFGELALTFWKPFFKALKEEDA